VRKLVTADRLLAEGKGTAAVCRQLGVSEATYHRWRNQFGGAQAEDAKRLKDASTSTASGRSPRLASSSATGNMITTIIAGIHHWATYPSPLCCHLSPPMNDSRQLWTNSRGPTIMSRSRS